MNAARVEGRDNLRDLRRQIPIVVTDFQYEIEKYHANLECLIDETSDLKGEIIGQEEEIKALKLQGNILDIRI